jgi:hypothetical protein
MACTTMKPRKKPRDFEFFKIPARQGLETSLVLGLGRVEKWAMASLPPPLDLAIR